MSPLWRFGRCPMCGCRKDVGLLGALYCPACERRKWEAEQVACGGRPHCRHPVDEPDPDCRSTDDRRSVRRWLCCRCERAAEPAPPATARGASAPFNPATGTIKMPGEPPYYSGC